jgi:hypothetical protein
MNVQRLPVLPPVDGNFELLAGLLVGSVVERPAQEVSEMCDYSLHGVESRPARVGDRLITTEFWNTTTRGFCSLQDLGVAVCLLPGTEIGFEREVERELIGFQLIFKRRRRGPIPHRVARFRQINTDNPCTHHDALEFPDGEIVLLTHLRAGQRASVLQLPAQAVPRATLAVGAASRIEPTEMPGGYLLRG